MERFHIVSSGSRWAIMDRKGEGGSHLSAGAIASAPDFLVANSIVHALNELDARGQYPVPLK